MLTHTGARPHANAHNLKQYQSVLQPGTRVMAMVKAFAYGSGGAEIAGILQYHKVDYLGVAYADEGVELRRAGRDAAHRIQRASFRSMACLANVVEGNEEGVPFLK